MTSPIAALVRANVEQHTYNAARRQIAFLANEGRVSQEQADKHNGGTAQILVDGERVGQASVLLVGPAAEYAVTRLIRG